MLYYDRTDISEGIDSIKSKQKKSKECMICHYWLFNQGFKFQDSLCNGCHNLLILCLNKSSITIITVFSVFLSQFFFFIFFTLIYINWMIVNIILISLNL